MNRRLFLAAAAAMAAGKSFAQQNACILAGTEPVRFIVPYAAGGPTDVAARILAETLSQHLSQHVVIENITGTGTTVGTARVAGTKDGHTFLIATVAHAVNAVLYANLAFDPVKDFRGVALMGTVPQIVLVRKDFAGTSLADLLAAARAKPAGLTYGSAGIGSAQHLAAELLASSGEDQHRPCSLSRQRAGCHRSDRWPDRSRDRQCRDSALPCQRRCHCARLR